jgi:hypothetical protein
VLRERQKRHQKRQQCGMVDDEHKDLAMAEDWVGELGEMLTAVGGDERGDCI